MYDTSAQRRAIFSLDVGDCPLNCIVAPPVHGGNTVVLGDTQGNVTMIDLRKRLPFGRYKGNAGSIRSVTAHPTQPILGVCGLDRHARLYDLKARKPLAQV
jgi:ribosome biogenesis protein NSA1